MTLDRLNQAKDNLHQGSRDLIRIFELQRWENFKDTTCPYWIGWFYDNCQPKKFGIADWLLWYKEISN